VALLPGADLTTLPAIGQRLLDAVRCEPFLIAGTSVRITVSIGGAVARPEDGTVDDVLRRADAALYEA